MSNYYFLRHGEATSNIHYDENDVDSTLTENGINQAENRAETLCAIQFDRIYSSNLTRALQTATIINKYHKLPLITEKELREKTFFKTIPKIDVHSKIKGYQTILQSLPSDVRWDFKVNRNAETDRFAALRIANFIKRTNNPSSDNNILVLSHSEVLRTFLVSINFAKFRNLPSGSFRHCGFFVLNANKDLRVTHYEDITLQSLDYS